MQQARAEEAVAALQPMAEVTASVVRDGVAMRVPTEDIVPGDVLVLAEGDAVSADARRVGIRVVMITGDHPRTAGRIAADLRIVEAGAATVAGVDIDRLDDGAFRRTVRDASVYARVTPEHKLRIVDALQGDGGIVAMTGDGVNDAPALKASDIGVAMGITGTDVTKEAADMILADDNFATIVAAVREGRGIFANIRTFLRYLLSSNVGEVLTMFFGVLLAGVIGLDQVDGAVATPLLATQILWINLLTDAAPALAMGVDPPPDDVMARPPRRLTDRVIDAEMPVGVLFVGTVMAGATLLTLDIGLPGGPGGRLEHPHRGRHHGLHHPRAGAALQLLQRPVRPGQRLPPPVHQRLPVGRRRPVPAAPAGGGVRARAERRVRHVEPRRRPVAGVRGHGEHGLVGRRTAQADRPSPVGRREAVGLTTHRPATRARAPVGVPSVASPAPPVPGRGRAG